MNKKDIIFSMVFVIFLIMACSFSGTDTTQVEATKMAIGIQQTQNAFIQETILAATSQLAQPTEQPTQGLDTAATQAQDEANQAATQQAQQAVEPPAEQIFPTETVEPEADHFAKIATYVRADEADYYALEDVRQAWTEKDTFWEMPSGQEAGNYVLSATLFWTAPEDMGDPARNGCGFIYGKSDPKHYHVTVVSPDQKVHTYRKRNNENIEMKGGDVPGGGLGVNSGSAEMVLVVEEKVMTTYINGVQVVMFNDPYIDYGQMGLAIDAATYSGFTCSFENVELWILK